MFMWTTLCDNREPYVESSMVYVGNVALVFIRRMPQYRDVSIPKRE